jgi:hypothetical protein
MRQHAAKNLRQKSLAKPARYHPPSDGTNYKVRQILIDNSTILKEITIAAFISMALLFTPLAFVMGLLDYKIGSNGNTYYSVANFGICGGVFIYGTIFALLYFTRLVALILSGLILNIIGTIAWLPLLLSRHDYIVGIFGACLSFGWALTIIETLRHRHGLPSKQTKAEQDAP